MDQILFLELMLIVDASAEENDPRETKQALRRLKKKGYDDTEAHAALAGMLAKAGNIQEPKDLHGTKPAFAKLLQKLVKGKLNRAQVNACIPEEMDAARLIYAVVHLEDTEENDAETVRLYQKYGDAFWKFVVSKTKEYGITDYRAFHEKMTKDGVNFMRLTSRISQSCYYAGAFEEEADISRHLLTDLTYEEHSADQLALLCNLTRGLSQLGRDDEVLQYQEAYEKYNPGTGFPEFTRLWIAKDKEDTKEAARQAELLMQHTWKDPRLTDMIMEDCKEAFQLNDQPELAEEAEKRLQSLQ